MFRNIGWPEILVVLAILLIVFGAAKLPQIAHSLGKSLTSFKKGLRETAEDVKDAIKEDAADDDASETGSDEATAPAPVRDPGDGAEDR